MRCNHVDSNVLCFFPCGGVAYAVKKLRDELTKALLEATEGNNINNEKDQIESFNQLVKEMTSKHQDLKTFAFKTKAMVCRYTPLLLNFLLVCMGFNSALEISSDIFCRS